MPYTLIRGSESSVQSFFKWWKDLWKSNRWFSPLFGSSKAEKLNRWPKYNSGTVLREMSRPQGVSQKHNHSFISANSDWVRTPLWTETNQTPNFALQKTGVRWHGVGKHIDTMSLVCGFWSIDRIYIFQPCRPRTEYRQMLINSLMSKWINNYET